MRPAVAITTSYARDPDCGFELHTSYVRSVEKAGGLALIVAPGTPEDAPALLDLVRGLAKLVGFDLIDVPGATGFVDTNYEGKGQAAVRALEKYDLVFVHIEAPDEAGHCGSIESKVEAIEKTDQEIIRRLREYKADKLRLLVMPDHPTPIDIQTHTGEPVPFVLSGAGFPSNGTGRLTEAEASASGFFIQAGYDIINKLIKGV